MERTQNQAQSGNVTTVVRYHIDEAMKRIQNALQLTDREMDMDLVDMPRDKALNVSDAILADAQNIAFEMDYPVVEFYRTLHYGRMFIAAMAIRDDAPDKLDEEEAEEIQAIMTDFSDQASSLQSYDPTKQIH